MIRIAIPIIAALLFRAGGSDQWKWCPLNQKIWRWSMGAVIGLLAWHGWIAWALTAMAYFIATNVFGYGDKSPILKYLPQNMKHLASGVIFGLASFPIIGWWALIQAAISGVVFYIVEVKKVNNPWAEFCRGAGGTICFLFFL